MVSINNPKLIYTFYGISFTIYDECPLLTAYIQTQILTLNATALSNKQTILNRVLDRNGPSISPEFLRVNANTIIKAGEFHI